MRVPLICINEVVDKTCHGVGSFRVGMVRDAGNDVEAAMGHRFVGCVCVGSRDHAILITADGHHWHTRIEMQAIQCTDRLAAAVYDGTQAFAGMPACFLGSTARYELPNVRSVVTHPGRWT